MFTIEEMKKIEEFKQQRAEEELKILLREINEAIKNIVWKE